MWKRQKRGRGGHWQKSHTLDYSSARIKNDLVPLAFLNIGEEGTVAFVNAGSRFTNRILGMGIRPGIRIKIVSKGCGGIVIQVGNTRYAFGFGMGMKIIVRRDHYG